MDTSLDHRELKERFRACGLTVTAQRAAIYRALVATTSHPTAEVLYQEVRGQHPMISRNTVYCTLSVLRQAGLVHEVNYGHDSARFDAKVEAHHHLICTSCRTIVDIMDSALNHVTVPADAQKGFAITGHRVEFYGVCAACRVEQKALPMEPRAKRVRSAVQPRRIV
jgi:Fur family peroxide stress response transcriptional regulator